ncbi:MAG: hypothetical protein ACKVQA_00680 [Burkholderiales bacterium]
MNSKLISLAIGATLVSASAFAGDFKYRGFDDRNDRHEQRHERRDSHDDRRFDNRRHWAPREHPRYQHWKPRGHQYRHHHDRWCNHWVPPHHAFGPSFYDGGSSITFILRGDLD